MNVDQWTSQLIFTLNPKNFLNFDPPPSGSKYEPVLSFAGATPMAPLFQNSDAGAPFALIRPGSIKHNPEHAELIDEATWTIGIFHSVANDQTGQSSLLGANRAGLGSSNGAGLLPVEPRVRQQVLSFNSAMGSRLRAASAPPVDVKDLQGCVAERSVEVVSTRLTDNPTYQPVPAFAAVNGSAFAGYFTILVNATVGVWSFVVNLSVGSVVSVAGADFAIGVDAAATAANLTASLNTKLAGIVAASSFSTVGAQSRLTLAGGETLTSIVAHQNTGGQGAASAATGSGMSLTWSAVPDRWDAVGYTFVRKSGATAPANPTDGTAVFVSGRTTVSASDTPPAGTWTYSIFAAYDAYRDPWSGGWSSNPPAPNRWSGFVPTPATQAVPFVFQQPTAVTVTV